MAKVEGTNNNGDAVVGTSTGGGAGVHGVSQFNGGPGVLGENSAGGPAGVFNGDVGISQTTPYTSLHIRKDIPSNLGPSITLMNNGLGTGAGGSVDFDGYDPGISNPPAARIQSLDDGSYSAHLIFLTKTVGGGPTGSLNEHMRIQDNGNVGIGTSSPADLLTVETAANDAGITLQGANSAGGVSPTLKFSDNAGTVHTRIGIAGAAGNLASGSSPNDLVIRTEGNNIALTTNYGAPSALTVGPTGNVGIGTSRPMAPLHVAGPGIVVIEGGEPFLTFIDISRGDGTYTGSPVWLVDGNGDLFRIFRRQNANAQDSTCLTIDNTGSVNVLKNLNVSGDVLLPGADCAEQFDAAGAEQIEPGTVVVIDQEGALRESDVPYDKKVAGVVSGAGEYRHGLVLDKRSSDEGRVPVALVGKVYCKVDARCSPIEVGDLLATSPTPGHAMKATDREKAFGSIIGKALKSFAAGTGLIPILVALQ